LRGCGQGTGYASDERGSGDVTTGTRCASDVWGWYE